MSTSAASQPPQMMDRAQRTRAALLSAAETLYANQGLDAVSLNQILAHARQNNRSALQYHFGNRQGLIQAIIDRHSGVIYDIRRDYMAQQTDREQSPAELAARVFVEPIARYVDQNPAGVHYVKILSQMAAANTAAIYGIGETPVALRMDPEHRALATRALGHLRRAEADRRTFISVGMVFHSLADIYRLGAIRQAPRVLTDRGKMVEQVVCALAAFYAAPAQ